MCTQWTGFLLHTKSPWFPQCLESWSRCWTKRRRKFGVQVSYQKHLILALDVLVCVSIPNEELCQRRRNRKRLRRDSTSGQCKKSLFRYVQGTKIVVTTMKFIAMYCGCLWKRTASFWKISTCLWGECACLWTTNACSKQYSHILALLINSTEAGNLLCKTIFTC